MCIGMANGGKSPKELTPQEAYEMLQARYVFIAEGIFDSYKVTDKLFEALEKQIPKKVEIEVFEDIDEDTGKPYTMKFEKCSACGEHIGLKSHRFCAYCGQRIDWSEQQ